MKTKNKPIYTDPRQIKQAAKFLASCNPHCSSALSMEHTIVDMIRKYAYDENRPTYSSTGGMIVVFSEDVDAIDVEVYVDPAIGFTSNIKKFKTLDKLEKKVFE